MKKVLVVLAMLTLVVAGSAQAYWTNLASNVWSTYTFNGTGYSGAFYYNTTSYKSGIALGHFTLSVPGSPWWESGRWWCADMSEYVGNSNRWYYLTDDNQGINAPPPPPGSGIQGTVAGNRRAAWILHTWNGSASTNIQRAALQLAVWEAIYDDGTFDLNSGSFSIGSLSGSLADQNAIRGQAATYSAGSKIGTGVYAYDNQNLLRDDIPEPGTLILLGVGLLGSGIASVRRRRNR